MSYHHLSTFERTCIEILSKMNYSTRQNRHHSTIARELKRNTQQMYQAEIADELAQNRRLVCHRPEKNLKKLFKLFNANLVI